MEGPRVPLTEELPQILDFLKVKLRKDSAWTIDEEYPTAFDVKNIHNLRIIMESDKVLSHAVIKPLIVKTPLTILKVAPIGSVVTDEGHRNQGLSHQVLSECLANAVGQQCDLAILWTNLYDFYNKLGFALAGSEISYELTKDFPTSDSEVLKFIEGPKIDPQAILKLYSKHSVSSIRTFDEIKKYLNIPNTRVYTAWNNQGQLRAYAVEGKGADLTGYIHEWGGSVPSLMKLFAHIVKTTGSPKTIIVPEHSHNLRRALEPVCTNEHHGHLGMIKILRPQSFFSKVQKAVGIMGRKDIHFEWVGDALKIVFHDEVLLIENEIAITSMIFGPAKASEIFQSQNALTETLDQIFPLPFWVWGWDSI